MGQIDGGSGRESRLEELGRDFQASFKKNLRDYAETLFFIIILALVVRYFFIGTYKVSSDELAPTLRYGDYIVGFKPSASFTADRTGKYRLSAGELVVFRCGQDKLDKCVRRIVGMPGDRMELRGEDLYRNGQLMVRNVANIINDMPGVIPPENAFVLGSPGMVSLSDFEAVPLFIWFSRSYSEQDQNFHTNWERIGNWLH